MRKRFALFKIGIKTNIAYIKDFIISNFFLFIMILIYIFLWKNIYKNKIEIGYTFNQLMWYLIINQMVFLGNGPLFRQVSSDIKSGDIAYHLNKPYKYIYYIFYQFLARNFLVFMCNSFFGIIAGIIFVGKLDNFNIKSIFPITIIMILGIILNILIYILISLTSFWFEENQSFTSLYQEIVFTFGGFLIPITLFPQYIEKINLSMPWAYISYHVANTCVNFNFTLFEKTLKGQILYILILYTLIYIVYSKGIRKVDINGG